MSPAKTLLSAACLMLAPLGGLRSQDAPPPMQQPADTPKKFDADALKAMLDKAGFKHEAAGDSEKIHLHGSDKLFIYAYAPSGRTNLWLTYATYTLKAVPTHGEGMLKLLTENRKMSPTHFAYRKKSKAFELQVSVTTTGMTADKLRDEIRALEREATRTRGLWDETRWTGGDGWQDGDPGAVGKRADEVSGAPAANSDAAGQAANSAKLREMLKKRFAVVEDVNAHVTRFRTNLKSDDLKELEVPTDSPLVWLSVPTLTVPKGEPDAAALLKLLAENGRGGPPHFVFDKATRLISLRVAVSLAGITEDKFFAEIDALAAEAQRTSELWNIENWKTAEEKK